MPSNFNLQLIQSVNELREIASTWDELWQRSEATLPLARSEPVADWLQEFAAGEFFALIVKDEEKLVAALPLVGCRVGKVLTPGTLPGNAWSPAGDFVGR